MNNLPLPVIIVAGPTASGKSAYALSMAQTVGGWIINADSMQIYSDLCVLTARPSSADLLLAPHRLYGILPGSHVCSAAEWVTRAVTEIKACWAAGFVPIVTGGTGLYVRALTQGLSPIPDIPEPVRAAARSLMEDLGPERFHQHLTRCDPNTAARLHPMDTQRNVRALEVFEATGRPLVEWQAIPPVPTLHARFFVVIFDPPRPWLYERCDERFVQMMNHGAVDEVRALSGLGLPPQAPIMKALGVPELMAYLEGRDTRDNAILGAQQATRRFAKRQVTWFRHQLSCNVRVDASTYNGVNEEISSFLRT